MDKQSSRLECYFSSGETLADALAHIAEKNPAIAKRVYDLEKHRVNSLVQITINGQLLPLAGGIDVLLHDGDEVLIFYAASGG
jgi:molybdopterin converting factor small subunit